MIKRLFFLLLFVGVLLRGTAQDWLAETGGGGAFPVATAAGAAPIVVDASDHLLVQKAAALLQQDVAAVSGKKPSLIRNITGAGGQLILIGSLDRSPLLQGLVQKGKLKTAAIRGKWEAYQVQVVQQPFAGVASALVIAGSDRRGTAYGVFELSRQMGVSPWYWWADVPVKKRKTIFLKKSTFTDAPKVVYRGIFINDEAPALSSWSKEKLGGFNHAFYEKVFELILRLKGNYLWPAMWGNAFYDDDPENIKMADAYGIVIGTSHHEPLMRAHDEWRRHGKGKWNYDSNAVALRQFWRGGMQRAQNEKIVSVGMRGDGDEPMSRETATALLERIVADQRKIIEEVTGRPATETPQLWALYKEVQDYYDKGMRVPDDVTLLLADDNWGNIRRLPKPNDKPRKGGYGIYYHFDYVGGPRNYKWLNTNNLARVWEQMHLAWAYGARQIWIVNVGDIKPMELPISFFLDYAWNPEKWNEDNLRSYYTHWAAQNFKKAHSAAIGEILRTYAQLSARRKPELLDAATYRFGVFEGEGEWSRVLKEWSDLEDLAKRTGDSLSAESKDAYFQLVLHPIVALANLHRMYAAVAANQYHASRNSKEANKYAGLVKHHYIQDSLITEAYHQLVNGKWNGMMSQTHIGYTNWQQPPVNKMPDVKWVTTDEEGVPASLQRTQNAKHLIPANTKGPVFYEQDGVVSMESAHFSKSVAANGIQWKVIPDIGRTGDGITTFPVTAESPLGPNSAHVAYDFYTTSTGKAALHLYFSPTLNFHNQEEGLQFAVSIDEGAPQVISLNKEDKNSISGIWNKWVAENIIIKQAGFQISRPGKHTVKYWAISPGVVLQKLVLDLGGLKSSFLGPQETIFNNKSNKQ